MTSRTYLLVSHAVVVEVGAGRKAFTTRRTFVRFLAGMNSSMSVE